MNNYNGLSVSSFISAGIASAFSAFATALSVANATRPEPSSTLYTVAGIILMFTTLPAIWAVIGGAIALNQPVKKTLPVFSVISGSACLLWVLFCAILGAN